MAQINVGDQLRADGEEIKKMEGTFQGFLDEAHRLVGIIDAGWEGLSHNAFMADYDRLSKTLEKLPETVLNLGQGAISAAKAYSDTDVAGAKRD